MPGRHKSLGKLGGGHVVHRNVNSLFGLLDGAKQMPADAAVRREVDVSRRSGCGNGEDRRKKQQTHGRALPPQSDGTDIAVP